MGDTFVVVGTGVAGTTAAFTLRSGGFDGRVVLVGAEPYEPYPRPPLSKDVLCGTTQTAQLRLRPSSFYQTRGVELRTGTTVTELDPAGRSLRLDDGSRLEFDRLLLATGGAARTLPQAAGVAGVHTLRTRADAESLQPELRPGRHVLVVGAGFIGAEVASSARRVGCEVTVLEAAATPLGRVLPPVVASVYTELHRSHGVDLRTGVGLERVVRDGSELVVTGTDASVYRADLVVLGVGMTPDVALAEAAGLLVEDGVLVDEYCRTSVPYIFAAGDVARSPNHHLGGTHRPEHWQHAQHQGAAAAKSMLGTGEPFTEVPWCWSDQYDVNLQICGWPAATDDVLVRGDLDALDAAVVFRRDGKITGAVGVNRADDVRALRQLVKHAPWTDDRALGDDTNDLARLVAATAA